MPRLILKQTCMEIQDYDLGYCPRLENQFMLWDRTNFRPVRFGLDYNEEKRTLYIPRGYDVYMVEQFLDENARVDRNYTRPYETGSFNLKVKPRDDIQREALQFMVGVGKYKDNQYKSQLALNLSTGKGKTYLSIATASYYEYPTVVISPSSGWNEQWIKRFLEYCDVPKKETCNIQGSAMINKLFKTKHPTYKFYTVTHSTLQTYATANGWDSIGELFEHLHIGIKIFDEAHMNFINTSLIDAHTNVYKTYYLTATPSRSSEDEAKIYYKYFKNVPGIDLFDEENDPHTKYIAIKYNSHPSVYEINNLKNQYGLDLMGYIDYLSDRPIFYKICRIMVDLAIKSNGKVLFYIGSNKAILKFYDWFITNYSEFHDDIGIYTSLVKDAKEKEAIKEKRFIVSTLKSAGAALDIKGLKMTIVLDNPFKSLVLAQQSLGRTRDNNTFYIDCIDTGFSQLLKFYRFKRQIFEKYAVSMSEIYLSDGEIERRNDVIINNRIAHAVPLITIPLMHEYGEEEVIPLRQMPLIRMI